MSKKTMAVWWKKMKTFQAGGGVKFRGKKSEILALRTQNFQLHKFTSLG